MPASPTTVETKLNDVTSAWENLAADKKFGGMTLDEFKARVKPSLDTRKAIKDLENKISAQQNLRDDGDTESLRLMALVVNGVKADPEEGEDSALYEAMGYVRKSERKSGLKRGKNKPASTPA